MSAHSLDSFALPGFIPLSQLPVLSLPFSLLIPKSDSDRWPGCLTRQCPPRPLSARCLFLCPVKRTQCQGPPREFPARGPEPMQLGRSRQCEFFTRLELSGGQEFTFGGCQCRARASGKLKHAQATYSLRPAGRLSYLVGITCIHIDLVASVYGFGALFPLEI